MTLKINTMYETRGGYLVPRSHFKDEKGVSYAIIERIVKIGTGYKVQHVTMIRKDIKKELGIAKNERVEIE